MKIVAYTPEELSRLESPRMAHYWKLYKDLPRWDGNESIEDKKVIVFCEQGFGDIIQFSRYFGLMLATGCELYLHCPRQLHRLFAHNWPTVKFIDYQSTEFPEAYCHVLSMSLPFLFSDAELPYPYLSVHESEDLGEFKGKFKIGIAWEGNPKHFSNEERALPLKHFRPLYNIPDTSFFLLQPEIHVRELTTGACDMNLYGVQLEDFYDTAKLINSLDVVVTVDTAVLHLAGAMGKETYGLLHAEHDPRWNVHRWYRSVNFFKHPENDFAIITSEIAKKLGGGWAFDRETSDKQQSILITAGIGDFITLDSFMSDRFREKVTKVYYATRAEQAIRSIVDASPVFPNLKEQVSLHDDFSDKFAIYSKRDLEGMPGFKPPECWFSVMDWSIFVRFPLIHYGYHQHHLPTVVKHKVADVSRFSLPDEYAVICHYSDNDARVEDREFHEMDWSSSLNILEKKGLKGVVLNKGPQCPMEDPYLIDLTNQTTLLEAIEITKGASWYIGIDSCLSVIAARVLPVENLRVKTVNDHCLKHKAVYYAPHEKFNFLNSKITFL